MCFKNYKMLIDYYKYLKCSNHHISHNNFHTNFHREPAVFLLHKAKELKNYSFKFRSTFSKKYFA